MSACLCTKCGIKKQTVGSPAVQGLQEEKRNKRRANKYKLDIMTTRVGFSHTMILPLRKLLREGGVYRYTAHQGVCRTGILRMLAKTYLL